jgi:hypothetical protein
VRPGASEALLQDLGLVLQHMAAAAEAGVELPRGAGGLAGLLPHAAVALKARRLLAMACDCGWSATAAAVLPLACAHCACAADMVAAIHAAAVPSPAAAAAPGCAEPAREWRGLTLLHRAVRSGSVALLAGVLAWGDAHGYRWRVDAQGPAGLTPLHLAAMQVHTRA